MDQGLPIPYVISEADKLLCSTRDYSLLNVAHEMDEFNSKLPLIRSNAEQYDIYKCVKHAVENNNQLRLFIDGPGGSGKTFLTIFLSNFLR